MSTESIYLWQVAVDWFGGPLARSCQDKNWGGSQNPVQNMVRLGPAESIAWKSKVSHASSLLIWVSWVWARGGNVQLNYARYLNILIIPQSLDQTRPRVIRCRVIYKWIWSTLYCVITLYISPPFWGNGLKECWLVNKNWNHFTKPWQQIN